MTMKKRIAAIACALAIALTMPTSAFAAEADALPGPSMTPASRLYFAETWMQHWSLMFTFRAEAKLQKALQYAGQKLAEMEAMAEKNQAQHMDRAAREYRYFLGVATRNMGRAMVGGNETSEQVARMMSRHISVMTNNQNGGSEDCQQIRTQTMERAEACQETAVRTLAGQNPEEALRLNLALMEQQCLRIQNCIGQEDSEQVEEGIRQYERLELMNQEIVACAAQLGKGPEAQQMIEEATASQSGILAQVRNQLRIGNADSTEPPVQNQTQEQEQYRLESGNADKPAPTLSQEQSGTGIGYGGDSGASSGSGERP